MESMEATLALSRKQLTGDQDPPLPPHLAEPDPEQFAGLLGVVLGESADLGRDPGLPLQEGASLGREFQPAAVGGDLQLSADGAGGARLQLAREKLRLGGGAGFGWWGGHQELGRAIRGERGRRRE